MVKCSVSKTYGPSTTAFTPSWTMVRSAQTSYFLFKMITVAYITAEAKANMIPRNPVKPVSMTPETKTMPTTAMTAQIPFQRDFFFKNKALLEVQRQAPYNCIWCGNVCEAVGFKDENPMYT